MTKSQNIVCFSGEPGEPGTPGENGSDGANGDPGDPAAAGACTGEKASFLNSCELN